MERENRKEILAVAALLLFLTKGISLAGKYLVRAGMSAVAPLISWISYLVPIGVYFCFFRRRGDISLGLPQRSDIGKALPFLPLLLLATMGISTLTAYLLSLFSLPAVGGEVDEGGIPFLILQNCLRPALLEEGLIRLALLSLFLRLDRESAPLLTAVCFALLHGNLYQFPYAFAGGLILSLVALLSGSVWVAVAFHFINNLLSLFLQKAEGGLVFPILATVLVAAGIWSVLALTHKKYAGRKELAAFFRHRAPRGLWREAVLSPLGVWGGWMIALAVLALF